MNKEIKTTPKITLVGIKTRTSFDLEQDPNTSEIFSCVDRYMNDGLFEKIPNSENPGVTYCVYTDYAADYRGEYTYFIGEKVSKLDEIPEELDVIEIPEQKCVKLTVGPAPMPSVVFDAWQKIWEMSPEELGGERAYKIDYEVYDERAVDQNKTVLDIFVSLK